ncbi:MAG: DNA primase, partial [Patescibacteria group bacterium]
GGDMFSFVMKIEGVEFPEALRILAKKANVELKQINPELHNEKTKSLDILQVAASYFHQNLFTPAGKDALEYLMSKRQLTEKTIKDFKLGWADEGWDGLLKFLQSKSYNQNDILKAGLILQRNSGSGFYDRFRGRIMFPIADQHGSIVGFTGRVLVDQENSPKYMNTPDTQTFNKSLLLYALDKAKQKIREEDLAVIVEGQMDVIASHQASVTNVVASSGTALTLQQIKLLKRYTPNLVLALDLDLAGQEATKRGIEIALQEEMNVKIAVDLAGKDPDEAIREGIEIWTTAIKNAKPVMEYYFDSTFAKYNISQIEGKKSAAKILIPVIAKFNNKIEQDYWLRELAQKLDTSESAIRETLNKIDKVKQFPRAEQIVQIVKKEPLTRCQILSEQFLSLVLMFSNRVEYLLSKYFISLDDEAFEGQMNIALAKELRIYYNNKVKSEAKLSFDPNDFILNINQVQLREYAEFLLLLAGKEFNYDDETLIVFEAKRLYRPLESEYNLRRSKVLTESIRQAEKSGDKEKLMQLIEEYSQLIKLRSNLD